MHYITNHNMHSGSSVVVPLVGYGTEVKGYRLYYDLDQNEVLYSRHSYQVQRRGNWH